MAQRATEGQSVLCREDAESQTLLYVGRRAEDVESLQSHAQGSQLAIQLLQTVL